MFSLLLPLTKQRAVTDIGGMLYGKYMRWAILFSIVLSQVRPSVGLPPPHSAHVRSSSCTDRICVSVHHLCRTLPYQLYVLTGSRNSLRSPKTFKRFSWPSRTAGRSFPSRFSSSDNLSSSSVRNPVLGTQIFVITEAFVVHSAGDDSQHPETLWNRPRCRRLHPLRPRIHILQRVQSPYRKRYCRCRPLQLEGLPPPHRVRLSTQVLFLSLTFLHAELPFSRLKALVSSSPLRNR